MENNNALERCKQWVAGTSGLNPGASPKEVAEYLFPELAKSEDEKIRKEMLNSLKEAEDSIVLTPFKKKSWIAYLERQKKQEPIKVYDNMDDLIADAIIDEISKSDMPDSAKHNRIYWINKHRQKPAEWSEEDEKKITFLERLIRYNVPEGQYGWADGHKGGFVTKLEAIFILKSLRPSWKPSEEQISALERAIVKMHTPDDIGILAELRDNLKKL